MTLGFIRSSAAAWLAGLALVAAVAVIAAQQQRRQQQQQQQQQSTPQPQEQQQTQLPPPTKRVEPPPDTTSDGKAVEDFTRKIKDYVALHSKFESALPKLPDKPTPQQVDANQRELNRLIKQARAGAKQGDLFSPAMQTFVRKTLVKIFSGPEGAARLSSVMDENPVGTKVGVNDRYPDSIPRSTMPPEVLQVLPKMPEELEYRFVGDNLIILDPHAHLVVDYVPAALPKGKKV